jgi:hypothetical protein
MVQVVSRQQLDNPPNRHGAPFGMPERALTFLDSETPKERQIQTPQLR